MSNVLLLVLTAALAGGGITAAFVIVSPRFKLTLVTEVGLGVMSISMLGIALSSLERHAGAKPSDPGGSAWMVTLLIVGAVVALLGARRHRRRDGSSLF